MLNTFSYSLPVVANWREKTAVHWKIGEGYRTVMLRLDCSVGLQSNLLEREKTTCTRFLYFLIAFKEPIDQKASRTADMTIRM